MLSKTNFYLILQCLSYFLFNFDCLIFFFFLNYNYCKLFLPFFMLITILKMHKIKKGRVKNYRCFLDRVSIFSTNWTERWAYKMERVDSRFVWRGKLCRSDLLRIIKFVSSTDTGINPTGRYNSSLQCGNTQLRAFLWLSTLNIVLSKSSTFLPENSFIFSRD